MNNSCAIDIESSDNSEPVNITRNGNINNQNDDYNSINEEVSDPLQIPIMSNLPINTSQGSDSTSNDSDSNNVLQSKRNNIKQSNKQPSNSKQRNSTKVKNTTQARRGSVNNNEDGSGDDSMPSTVMESKWCDNIERVLDKLRRNCAQLSSYHNYKYQYCKKNVVFFKVPIIMLSGINTFISVGINKMVSQDIVSIATSLISLFCGIITSIEMLMKYQDKMENELDAHRSYYKLSIDIYKMISVERKFRKTGGKDFLEEKFGEYEKLRSKCRPEEHTELIFDLLGEMEELFVYNREDKSWKHKNAVPPRDLGYMNDDNDIYDFNSAPYKKRNIFEKIFDYFKRNQQKDTLAAQSKRLRYEHANDVSQEYLDSKRKKTKIAAAKRKDRLSEGPTEREMRITHDGHDRGFFGYLFGGRRKSNYWDGDYLTDDEII